jgi:hypothetical protein
MFLLMPDERAYGIWPLEFRKLPAFCGMVGRLIIGKNSAWNMSPQPCSRAIAAQIPSKEIGSGYLQETHPDRLFGQCSHYCELASDPEPMPRVLESAFRLQSRAAAFSVIAYRMRATRFWRDSGLSFERAAVGSWIAVGAAEEVVAT